MSLAPTTPFTNDTLTATATKADADGNAVTLTYVWKVNGVTVKTTSESNALTDTLDLSQPGNGDPGDQVTVTVTPNDGTDPGAPVISNTATVSTVNGTPTASGSNFAITKDAGRSITLKATDPEGDTLTYTIATPPAHGTLSAGTGGVRTFTPAAGYSGADSFTFRVSDGSTTSGLATVNLTVAQKYKVTITDSAFSPIASKPVQGGTVRFVNSGTAARTITDASGMGLFGASINPGSEVRLPLHRGRQVRVLVLLQRLDRACRHPGEDLAGRRRHQRGPHGHLGRRRSDRRRTCSTSRSNGPGSRGGATGGPASRR